MQNETAERWVGTAKRDLLDDVIVPNESHLRRLLRAYVAYYNEKRVHTVIRDAPKERNLAPKLSRSASIAPRPRLGGLHHVYQ
ncbi:MAG: transposase [Deltaproteobacteria bacterium]|nr:transposase [Deltaproteobacteria bacterium]